MILALAAADSVEGGFVFLFFWSSYGALVDQTSFCLVSLLPPITHILLSKTTAEKVVFLAYKEVTEDQLITRQLKRKLGENFADHKITDHKKILALYRSLVRAGFSSDKIGGFTGDLTNMETLYVAKEFFNKTIKSKYLDYRVNNSYVNTNNRENYIFNSTILLFVSLENKSF